MQRPDVQLGQVVIGSDRRLSHLRVHQVLHVEEGGVESCVIAAHSVDVEVFITRIHVLAIDLADDTSLARPIIPQQKQVGVLLFVALYHVLQDRIPEVFWGSPASLPRSCLESTKCSLVHLGHLILVCVCGTGCVSSRISLAVASCAILRIILRRVIYLHFFVFLNTE